MLEQPQRQLYFTNKWYETQGKPWTLKNRCKLRGIKPNIPPIAGLVQLSILIAQLRYFSKQSFTNNKAWLIVKPMSKELDVKFYYSENIHSPHIKKTTLWGKKCAITYTCYFPFRLSSHKHITNTQNHFGSLIFHFIPGLNILSYIPVISSTL